MATTRYTGVYEEVGRGGVVKIRIKYMAAGKQQKETLGIKGALIQRGNDELKLDAHVASLIRAVGNQPGVLYPVQEASGKDHDQQRQEGDHGALYPRQGATALFRTDPPLRCQKEPGQGQDPDEPPRHQRDGSIHPAEYRGAAPGERCRGEDAAGPGEGEVPGGQIGSLKEMKHEIHRENGSRT